MRAIATALLCGAALAGCGGHPRPRTSARLPADYVPVSVGPGRAFQPPAITAAVRAGRPVRGLRCAASRGPRFGAHVEIFAHDHVVAIPTGVGVRPPLAVNEDRIVAARCYYPLITTDATGVLEIARGARLTLGTLFTLWGQPLSRHRVAGFRTARPLVAYLGTRAWPGDPAAIPLRRHTRVVLELATRIPPHTTYEFPPGL